MENLEIGMKGWSQVVFTPDGNHATILPSTLQMEGITLDSDVSDVPNDVAAALVYQARPCNV